MLPRHSFRRARESARRPWLAWAGLALVLASGCLYDSGSRSDRSQRFDPDSGVCVCKDNTIAGDHGCVACAEHELAQGGSCVCDTGYSRPPAGGPCAVIPQNLGAHCDPAAPSCDASYPTCHALAASDGYCTSSGCATNDDCTGGYACDTSVSPSYCQRPPTGVGQSCASSADCASYEASYCETLQSHVCLVQGCSKSPDDCFSGNQCCDLSGFGLPFLCVPTGTCPVP
jgi:hypothetical protein